MVVPAPARAPWERGRALKPVEPHVASVGGGSAPKRYGTRFEYSIKLQLERRGWYVMRAYSSKGVIDLLAVARDRPAWFVQAKARGVISSSEWNAVYELATRHGGWPILAVRESKRLTAYYRLDGLRAFRGRARPCTRVDPVDCRELLPPPSLLG